MLRCRNPQVTGIACVMALMLSALVFYAIPASFAFASFERYAPAGCVVLSYFVAPVQCGAGASGGAATCFTCCFSCAFESREGTKLVAYTVYDPAPSTFTTDASARAYCEARSVASHSSGPLPCWYSPAQSADSGSFLLLAAPALSASLVPIALFATCFVSLCVVTCACQLRSAPTDPLLQRAYVLARQRAREANYAALQWTGQFRDVDADADLYGQPHQR